MRHGQSFFAMFHKNVFVGHLMGSMFLAVCAGFGFFALYSGNMHAQATKRMPASASGTEPESEAMVKLRQRLSDPAPGGYGFNSSPAKGAEDGMQCIGHLPDSGSGGYPEEVAILVPWKFSVRDDGTARYIVHLLGYIGLQPWDGTLEGNLNWFHFLTTLSMPRNRITRDHGCAVQPGQRFNLRVYFGNVSGNAGKGINGSFQDFMSQVVTTTGINAYDITLTSPQRRVPGEGDPRARERPEDIAGKITGVGLSRYDLLAREAFYLLKKMGVRSWTPLLGCLSSRYSEVEH